MYIERGRHALPNLNKWKSKARLTLWLPQKRKEIYYKESKGEKLGERTARRRVLGCFTF